MFYLIKFPKKVLAVVGPTCSGKTRLSIELACILNGEIVSADSMQVYKGLDIGTAKPDPIEMRGIKHHLMDFVDPSESFSVAEYVRLAKECIDRIMSENKTPIVCGGTGLYVDSLLSNTKFDDTAIDYELRSQLIKKGETYGGKVLLSELSAFDKTSSERLHENDLKRIVRAIEIYYTTGKTLTDHIRDSRVHPLSHDCVIIGLNYKDRSVLYDNINKRVDQMIKKGLENETRNLLKQGLEKCASSAIGYKEMISYVRGECDLSCAVDLIKRNTRRYAKRQLTWFRRNEEINWIYVDEYKSFNDVLRHAIEIVSN